MNTFLYILTLFVANVIQGITGFAGAVLAMPSCALLLGVDDARGTLDIIALLSGAFMSIWFRKDIAWRELGKILLLVSPGIAVGIWAFNVVPGDSLLVYYGGVVAAVGLWYLLGQRDIRIPKPIMLAILFLGGLMQGMFVSGGPLIVIYAVTILRDKKSFRATLSMVWLILNTVVLCQALIAGKVTPGVIDYTLIGLVPLIAATIIGGLLQKRLDQNVFMKLTYVLLIISGAMLVFNGILQ